MSLSGFAEKVWKRLWEPAFWARTLLTLPLLVLYYSSGESEMIAADARRWIEIGETQGWRCRPHLRGQTLQLLYLLTDKELRAFRSVLYYRVGKGALAGRFTAAILKRIYKGELKLVLEAESIGPGIYVAHGYCAGIVWGTVVGSDFWMQQRVTIGWGASNDSPHIGDRVTIYTGAVVLGGITIGDDVVIGANAVVTKDVPAGVVARGVPAKYYPRTEESLAASRATRP